MGKIVDVSVSCPNCTFNLSIEGPSGIELMLSDYSESVRYFYRPNASGEYFVIVEYADGNESINLSAAFNVSEPATSTSTSTTEPTETSTSVTSYDTPSTSTSTSSSTSESQISSSLESSSSIQSPSSFSTTTSTTTRASGGVHNLQPSLSVGRESYYVGELVEVRVLAGGEKFNLSIDGPPGLQLILENYSDGAYYFYRANAPGRYRAYAVFRDGEDATELSAEFVVKERDGIIFLPEREINAAPGQTFSFDLESNASGDLVLSYSDALEFESVSCGKEAFYLVRSGESGTLYALMCLLILPFGVFLVINHRFVSGLLGIEPEISSEKDNVRMLKRYEADHSPGLSLRGTKEETLFFRGRGRMNEADLMAYDLAGRKKRNARRARLKAAALLCILSFTLAFAAMGLSASGVNPPELEEYSLGGETYLLLPAGDGDPDGYTVYGVLIRGFDCNQSSVSFRAISPGIHEINATLAGETKTVSVTISGPETDAPAFSINQFVYLPGEEVVFTIGVFEDFDLWIDGPDGTQLLLQNYSGASEYVYLPSAPGSYACRLDTGHAEYFASFEVAGEEQNQTEAVFSVYPQDPVQGEIVIGEPVSWTQEFTIENPPGTNAEDYVCLPIPEDAFEIKALLSDGSTWDDACGIILLAPGESSFARAEFKTAPVDILVSEEAFDLLSLLPSDASELSVYDGSGMLASAPTPEELPAENLSLVAVRREVTLIHNSSLHYHNISFEFPVGDSSDGIEIYDEERGPVEKNLRDGAVELFVDRLSNRTFRIGPAFERIQGRAVVGEMLNWTLRAGNTSIEYKTPAPEKREEMLSSENWKKKVTIESNASMHYYNVSAYSDLPENPGNVRLYWLSNGSRIDVTGDAVYGAYLSGGRIYWNVPQLSEQEFEIEVDLQILTVQSYPVVGGNWTVEFNTTGKANLTIRAVDGTTWSDYSENSSEYDLKFLEIRCGEEILEYEWLNDSVFIKDYYCNETGYEVSHVLSFGTHTLEFTFGNDTEAAHNFACNSGTLSTTCYVTSSQSVTTSEILGTGNLVIQSGGALTTSAGAGTDCNISMGGYVEIQSGGYMAGNFRINASNLTIASGAYISANSYGYAGGWMAYGSGPGGGGGGSNKAGAGASYGGSGGWGGYGGMPPGALYGSEDNTSNYGSGGGGGCTGGSGGGLIHINVTGNLVINGSLYANGGNGAGSGCGYAYGGAGGSGGGIFIAAKNISGVGTLTCNGGTGATDLSYHGGGGGGGRIAILYTDIDSFRGYMSASGGGTGIGGTIYLRDLNHSYAIMNLTNFCSSCAAYSSVYANVSISDRNITFNSLAGGTLIVNADEVNVSGTTLTNIFQYKGKNLNVLSTGSINTNSYGYGGAWMATGAGPGGGGGGSNVAGAGASYGGSGGGGAYGGASPGAIYGSQTNVSACGSGGGGGCTGGSGGGLININVTGNVVINGSIYASGGNGAGSGCGYAYGGAGGSGGGISIISRTISGAGALSCDGGTGGSGLSYPGGGGGGGRILIHYLINSSSCTMSVAGGTASGATAGSAGTKYGNMWPNVTSINISPSTAYPSDNLSGNVTIRDKENTSIIAYWYWYNGSALALSGNTTVSNDSNTLASTLYAGNTSKDETWTFVVIPFDGYILGDTINTSTTILSSDSEAPNVSLISPINLSGDNDGNVSFTYNVSDLSSVSNCSLIFGGSVNQTNDSVTKDTAQYFYLYNLSAGTYNWSINCTDGNGYMNSSGTNYFDVVLTTGFDGETTNLSAVSNLSDIADLTLELLGVGKIFYREEVNLSGGANLTNLVNISSNLVSIDSTSEQRLDKSATVFMHNLSYLETPLVLKDGVLCSTCTNVTYGSGTLVFNVTGFSAYTSGANSNLSIWDDGDEGSVYQYANVSFYANYTNKTSGDSINGSGVYCNITFNISGSWTPEENMSFDTAALLYKINRSFYSNGTFAYNITCNGTALGYEPLNATDTVTIENLGPTLNFTLPTEENDSTINRNWTQVNITIIEPNLDTFKFNWNGTNYSFYDKDLVLALNFNNNSAIGESSNTVVDISRYGNNLSCSSTSCSEFTSSGRYVGAYRFDGLNDYFNTSWNRSTLSLNSNFTVMAWFNRTGPSETKSYETLLSKGNIQLDLFKSKPRFILGNGTRWGKVLNLSNNSDASFLGAEASDMSAYSVSGVGDVNGDGYDDFVIGAYSNDEGGNSAGQAYLILGAASGWSMDVNLSSGVNASFIGEATNNYAGYSVSGVGDVNGDGFDDFLIGAYGYSSSTGQAYLILGRASGWTTNVNLGSGSNASFIGEASSDMAGRAVSGVGDVNGDGFDDFLIGAYGYSSSTGQAYLILGRASGWGMDLSLANANASFIGETEWDYAGSTLSGAGDVNGDGFDDFLIGAYGYPGGSNTGQAYLILGGASGWSMDVSLSSVNASFLAEVYSDSVGRVVSGAGDVNGDGYDDFLVGADGNDAGGSQAGQAYLILGGASGWSMDVNLSEANASFIGEDADNYAGQGVSGVGDVNGDGFDDFLVGAPHNSAGGNWAGQVYLVLGKVSGWSMDVNLSEANASFIGEETEDYAGSSVSGVGDVNGDGYADFVIGAYGNGGTYSTGQTYLLLTSVSTAESSEIVSNDSWHHVVGTFDDANLRIYVDGVLKTSVAKNNPVMNTTVPLILGVGRDEANKEFNGTIDEVRVYNRTLTYSEILMHYQSEFQKYNSTEYRFYCNVTNLSEAIYTYYGWANDTIGNYNSTEVRTLNFNTAYINLNFTSPTWGNSTQVNTSSAQVNISVNLSGTLDSFKFNWNGTNYIFYDDSLLLALNFNNNSEVGDNQTTAVDISKYGNNATVRGSALKFEGFDDYVNFSVTDTDLLGSDPVSWSAEAWFKTSFLPADNSVIVSNYDSGGAGDSTFAFYLAVYNKDSVGRLTLLVRNDSATTTFYSSGDVVDGRWHHAAMTASKTENLVRMFLDGVLVNESTLPNLGDYTDGGSFRIGASRIVGSVSRFFNGSIDEVRVYNRSLSETEVAEHYNGIFTNESGLVLFVPFGNASSSAVSGDVAIDYSGLGNNGNLTDFADTSAAAGDSGGSGWTTFGRPTWTNEGRYGYGMVFNKVNDFLDAGNSSVLNMALGNLSVMGWVKGSGTGMVVAKANAHPYYYLRVVGGKASARLLNNSENYYDVNSTTLINDGLWHHFAAVYNRTTNLTVYVDGVAEGSLDISAVSSRDISNANNLGIGANLNPGGTTAGNFFNGTIDEVRIYNRTLNASEILMQYQSEFQKYNSTEWRFYCNVTNITLSANYTYFGWANDTSGNWNTTETRSLTVLLPFPINFTYPTEEDSANITANHTQINISISPPNSVDAFKFNWNGTDYSFYDDSLVLALNFNNNSAVGDNQTTAVDVSRYWNNAAIRGSALMFDGSDDYVEFTDGSVLDVTGNISVEAWVKFSANDSQDDYVLVDKLGGGARGYRLIYNKVGGFFRFRADGEGGIASASTAYFDLSLDRWYHVVGVYDGLNALIYLDGELKKNNSCAFGSINSSSLNLTLGKEAGISAYWLNGPLDEVRIYNRSLNPAEVSEHYNGAFSDESGLVFYVPFVNASGATATDYSGQGNNGVLTNFADTSAGAGDSGTSGWTTYGRPAWTNAGKYGYGVSLNGVGDYLSCGNDSSLEMGLGNMTLMSWVKGSWNLGSVVAKNWGTPGFSMRITGGVFNSRFYTSGTTYMVNSSTLVNDSVWHHITAVFNRSGNLTVYVDGVAEGSADISAESGLDVTNGYDLGIGVNLYSGGTLFGSNSFNGSIDEVLIYNRTLTASEILMHYQSEFQKYNSTEYRFYCNVTNLSDGTYTYYGWANDTSGNYNSTEVRTLNVSPGLSCGALASADTVYNLTRNVSSAGTCFTIAANNVTLDCQGYSINYSQTEVGYAVNNSAGYDYINVRNCNILQGGILNDSFGIYFNGSENGSVTNSSITTNGNRSYSAHIVSSRYNDILYNTIHGYGVYTDNGIRVDSNSYYNNFSFNTIITTGFGSSAIYLNSGSNNTILSNNISTTFDWGHGIILSYDSHSNNVSLNTIYTNGSSAYGINIYYTSNYNNVSSNTLSTNGSSAFGIYVYSSSNNSVSYNGISTLGSSGHGIYPYSNADFNNFSSNTIFTNGTYGHGIHLFSSSNNNFTQNNISTNGSTGYGIYLHGNSASNSFGYLRTSCLQAYAVYLNNNSADTPENNTFYNDLFNASTANTVYFDGITSPAINYWNTSKQSGTRIYSSGTQIGGNFYASSTGTGYSETCVDANYDGFCDDYYNVSTNSSCTASTCGNNTDYLVLCSTGQSSPPALNLIYPTVDNDTHISVNYSRVNVSIVEADLDNFSFNWNGSDYSFYDDSLVLALNFNNNTAIGENLTLAVDISKYGNNGTISGDKKPVYSQGRFGQGLKFENNESYVSILDSASLDSVTDELTVEVWLKPDRDYTEEEDKWYYISYRNGLQYVFGYTGWADTLGFSVYNDSTNQIAVVGADSYLYNNTWYHVVGVYDGSYVRIYLDGVYRGASNPLTGNLKSGSNIVIGYNSGPSEVIEGTFDEFRVYNRVLSEDEIWLHYQSEFQRYNSTEYRFYVNVTNLTEGAYTYYAWANDTAGSSDSTEIRTVSVDLTRPAIAFTYPTPASGSVNTTDSVYVNVSVNDSNNVSAFIDWNRSLVGWWSFDNVSGTTVYDGSSYGNNGTMTENMSVSGNSTSGPTESGQYGKGMKFDGIDDYVKISNFTNFSGSYTIMAWINPRVTSGQSRHIVSRWGSGGAGNAAWAFLLDSNGKLYIQNYNGSSSSTLGSLTSPQASTMTFVAAVYSGGTSGTNAYIYINGALDKSGTLSVVPQNSTYWVGIGATYGMGSDAYWNGTIDEVRIWNRALSPEEINASFNAGSWRLYRNFTDLPSGNYTYTAYSIDQAGNVNSTEERSVSLNVNAPSISSVVLNDSDGESIQLSVLDTQVWCNASVTDDDGWQDIVYANATLYYMGSSLDSADDKNSHYGNSSCELIAGTGIYRNVSCGFSLEHEALNGSWNCTVTVMDTVNSSAVQTGNNTVDELIAISLLESEIGYGSLAPGANTSTNQTVNVTNLGNTLIDVEVNGSAMDCTVRGTIPVNNTRYALSSATFDQMSIGLSTTSTNIPAFDLGVEGVATAEDLNSTKLVYWTLMASESAEGVCRNNITVTAVLNV